MSGHDAKPKPAPYERPGIPALWPFNIAADWLLAELVPRFEGWENYHRCSIDGEQRWLTEELRPEYHQRIDDAGGLDALSLIVDKAGGEDVLWLEVNEDARITNVCREYQWFAEWGPQNFDQATTKATKEGRLEVSRILDMMKFAFKKSTPRAATATAEVDGHTESAWWESTHSFFKGWTPRAFDDAIARLVGQGREEVAAALKALKTICPTAHDVISPVFASDEMVAELDRFTAIDERLPEILAENFNTLRPHWQFLLKIGGKVDRRRTEVLPVPMHAFDWVEMTAFGRLREAFEFPTPAVAGEVVLEDDIYRLFFIRGGVQDLARTLCNDESETVAIVSPLPPNPVKHWDFIRLLLADNPTASYTEALRHLDANGFETAIGDTKITIHKEGTLISSVEIASFQSKLSREKKGLR